MRFLHWVVEILLRDWVHSSAIPAELSEVELILHDYNQGEGGLVLLAETAATTHRNVEDNE